MVAGWDGAVDSYVVFSLPEVSDGWCMGKVFWRVTETPGAHLVAASDGYHAPFADGTYGQFLEGENPHVLYGEAPLRDCAPRLGQRRRVVLQFHRPGCVRISGSEGILLDPIFQTPISQPTTVALVLPQPVACRGVSTGGRQVGARTILWCFDTVSGQRDLWANWTLVTGRARRQSFPGDLTRDMLDAVTSIPLLRAPAVETCPGSGLANFDVLDKLSRAIT